MAIQSKVIGTRNYQKHILCLILDDRWRLCDDADDFIKQIMDGCSRLARREYTRRYDDVAKIIQQQIALHLGLIQDWLPDYRYVPIAFLENENLRLYWDRNILTDHTVVHNRPAIVFLVKR